MTPDLRLPATYPLTEEEKKEKRIKGYASKMTENERKNDKILLEKLSK